MSDLNRRIDDCIQRFATDMTGLLRRAAVDSVARALDGNGAAAPRALAPSRGGRAAASAPRGRGAKRSPEELAELTDRLERQIHGNPGQRIEEIAEALAVGTRELQLPAKKLQAAGSVRTEGQKRSTRYYPG